MSDTKNKTQTGKAVTATMADDAMSDSDMRNAAIGAMQGNHIAPSGAKALSTSSNEVRTGMIVTANGSVGMVPPANAMTHCGGHQGGGEGARNALRKANTMVAAKAANQAFPAMNGGASVQPSLDGTGSAIVFGGANYMSVGCYQGFGYQSPPMGAGHDANATPLALHLTAIALTGLIRAATGETLSEGQRAALVPLAVWAAKSGPIVPCTGS